MFANDRFAPVIETIELMRGELRELNSRRLYIRVLHGYRTPGTDCMSGEEVLAIFLVHRSREYQLALSPALLLVADYLVRNSRFAQTASQISGGIRINGFYSERYGINGNDPRGRIKRIPRTSIREYIRRLHKALALAFHKAKLHVDPVRVLTVEHSVGNQVLYRWNATVEVLHHDLNKNDVQPLW
jgi:hypothetical protein